MAIEVKEEGKIAGVEGEMVTVGLSKTGGVTNGEGMGYVYVSDIPRYG